jgi:predicted O-linked N-acetylglucosamine transferase (SPINDLY family)
MADRVLALASEHARAGRRDQAIALLKGHVQRAPADLNAASLLAFLLSAAGQVEQAEFHARRVADRSPGSADAALNHALILARLGRHAEAADRAARAAALNPADPAPYRLLAAERAADFRLDEAVAAADAGLAAAPGDEELLASRARSMLMLGRATDAVAALRAAAARHPDSIRLARLLASAAVYDAATGPDDLFALHRRAGDLLARAVPDPARPRPADPDPDRPLRIGFLSSDLCNHVVAFFLLPLFRSLDRREFTVAAYSTTPREDHVSAALRAHAALWRHAPDADPGALAAAIRADAVDILVELNGYTGNCVLDVLAHRPAPVQATWLGYPHSTGFDRVDFRLVDSRTDPADGPFAADAWCTERLVRVDPCFICYEAPGSQAPPPLEAPPCGDGGPVTFGSFNAFQKINGPLLDLWRRLLESVPGSRLVIKNMGLAGGPAREGFRRRLDAAGLDPARTELAAPEPRFLDHLRAYHRVDIALDTFPYSGTTTTCEALFMGVPVVTLAGRTHASRVSLSLLAAAGLGDLAATDADAYVAVARDLAIDRDRLRAVRTGLRRRFLSSPAGDAADFGRRFGATLRRMWREAPSRR